MALLSGLFGNTDSDTGNSSDLLGILDIGGSFNASNESYSQSVDEDGSSDTSYDATSIGGDLDVGSLFSSITDSFSSSDQDGGGLFG